MPIFIHDETTVASLVNAAHSQDLRTTDGRLLGKFIPAGDKSLAYPDYEFGMSEEELDARENRPDAKWYTHEEVMERLRQLRKDK